MDLAVTFGSIQAVDEAQFDIVIGEPEIEKSCRNLNGELVAHLAPVGTANAECTVVLTNPTEFVGRPNTNEMSEIEVIDWVFGYQLDLDFEFISYSKNGLLMEARPSGIVVEASGAAWNDPAPATGTMTHVTSGVTLAPGESFTFSYLIRLMPHEFTSTTSSSDLLDNYGALAGANLVRVQSYRIDTDGHLVDLGDYGDSDIASIRANGGWARLSKSSYRPSVLESLLTDQTLPTLFGSKGVPTVAPDETVSFTLSLGLVEEESIGRISIADHLPPGLEYVVGSARVVWVDDAGQTQSEPVTPTGSGTAPLLDPPECTESAAWASDEGGYLPDGSRTLHFEFDRDGPGVAAAPWNRRFPAFTNTEVDREVEDGDPNPSDRRGLERTDFTLVYDAIVELDPACLADGISSVTFSNIAELQWALAGEDEPEKWFGSDLDVETDVGLDGRPATVAANFINASRDVAGVSAWEPFASKSPDSGLVADGSTGTYRLALELPGHLYRVTCENYWETEDPIFSELPDEPELRYAWRSECGGIHTDATPMTTGPVAHGGGFLFTYVDGNTFNPVAFDGPQNVIVPTRLGMAWEVTDTLVDDGHFVCGSADVVGLDPWGDEVPATTLDELSCVRGTDPASGRPNVTVTWRVEGLPLGFSVFHEEDERWTYWPSGAEIEMPLPVPVDTIDGTQYPNSMSSSLLWTAGGETVKSFDTTDEGLLTVINPSPPPVVDKTASASPVAPGEEFIWTLSAQFDAQKVWLDLAMIDEIPPNTELVSV